MRIHFYLGSKCNLKCSYCNVNQNCNNESDINVIDELIRKYPIDSILISGGEPTLYKNKIIEIIKKYNFLDIEIISNGTNLDVLFELYNISNKIKFTISWDGNCNDRGFDSFKTMKKLYENNMLNGISMVISNSNHRDLYNYIKQIYDNFPKVIENNEFECNLMITNDINYNFDLKKFSEEIYKVYKLIPNLGIFNERKELCSDFNKPIDILEITREGKILSNGCVDKLSNFTPNNICDECDIYECNVRICPVRQKKINLSNPHNNHCKIRRAIKNMKEKIELEKVEERLFNISAIELILTTGCNMACKYCFQSAEVHKNFTVVTTETIDKMFDKFKNLKEITLFGGEPLQSITLPVRKHLIDKIKEKEDFFVYIITNGYSITNDEIEWLKELKKYSRVKIQVSIDGIKEVNDSYRVSVNNKPTYDIIFNNLKKLEDILGVENININSVLMLDKLEHLHEWVKILEKNKYNFSFRFDQRRSESLTKEEKQHMLKGYKQIIDEAENGNISIKSLKKVFHLGNYVTNLKYTDKKACSICHTIVSVDPEGNIIPCHYFINQENKIIYNLYTGIKNSAGVILNEMSRDLKLKSKYKNCDECHLNCVKCKGYFYSIGNIEQVSDFNCEVYTEIFNILKKYTGNKYLPLTDEELLSFQKDIEEIQKMLDIEPDNIELLNLLAEMVGFYETKK